MPPPPVPVNNTVSDRFQNICQLDGNISLENSSLFSDPSCACCNIPSCDNSTVSDQDYDLEPVSAIPVFTSTHCLQVTAYPQHKLKIGSVVGPNPAQADI